MFDVPRLKIRPGTASYAKGQTRVIEILEAALDILIDEGYRALTMRRIATACGITVGNLTYYYPNKTALVRDLLDGVIQSYMDIFDDIGNDESLSAEEKFTAVLRLILEDIRTKKTTHLFLELWALSNHDAFIAKEVDTVYQMARRILNNLIAILNPVLTTDERETVALFVSASLEGLTVFAGYDKPWLPRMRELEGIAVKSLLDCVKTITAADIARWKDEAETIVPPRKKKRQRT